MRIVGMAFRNLHDFLPDRLGWEHLSNERDSLEIQRRLLVNRKSMQTLMTRFHFTDPAKSGQRCFRFAFSLLLRPEKTMYKALKHN
ncbi:5-hydroxytryptamine receptor [Trichinella pseudospiralis]